MAGILLVSASVLSNHHQQSGQQQQQQQQWTPVLECLSRSFRLKPHNDATAVSLIIPGMLSVGIELFRADELVLGCTRDPLINRLRQAKANVRNVFAIMYGEYELLAIRRAMMLQCDESVPSLLYCNTPDQVQRTVTILGKVFTKERDTGRKQGIERMQEGVHTRDAVIRVLQCITDVRSEDADNLLDCFGSLSVISQLTANDIMANTPCSRQTAWAIQTFFHSSGSSSSSGD